MQGYVLPKRRTVSELQCLTGQKTVLFMNTSSLCLLTHVKMDVREVGIENGWNWLRIVSGIGDVEPWGFATVLFVLYIMSCMCVCLTMSAVPSWRLPGYNLSSWVARPDFSLLTCRSTFILEWKLPMHIRLWKWEQISPSSVSQKNMQIWQAGDVKNRTRYFKQAVTCIQAPPNKL